MQNMMRVLEGKMNSLGENLEMCYPDNNKPVNQSNTEAEKFKCSDMFSYSCVLLFIIPGVLLC